MATYYVSVQTGSDVNDGLDPNRAWATISKAAATLQAGDTVYIAPGRYHEQVSPVNAGVGGAPISFIGDPDCEHFSNISPGDVVITGLNATENLIERQYGFFVESKNYLIVKNIIIEHVYDNGFHFNSCPNSIVENCRSQGLKAGIYINSSANFLLKECHGEGRNSQGIYVNSSPGSNLQRCRGESQNSDGIYLSSSSNSLLVGCKGEGGNSCGIYVYQSTYVNMRGCRGKSVRQHGIYVHNNCDNTVLSGCKGEGANVGIYVSTGTDYVKLHGCEGIGGEKGIQVGNDCPYAELDHCQGRGGMYGIAITDGGNYYSNNPVLKNCEGVGGDTGIYLYYIRNIVMEGCYTSSGNRAFYVYNSTMTSLEDCYAYESRGIGYDNALLKAYRVYSPGSAQVLDNPLPPMPPVIDLHLDRDFPIAGTQSAKLPVPTYNEYSWKIPASFGVAINVTLVARKNFNGGSVRFCLGDQVYELADEPSVVQHVALQYTPDFTGFVELTVIAETDDYNPTYAVWIDNILVS